MARFRQAAAWVEMSKGRWGGHLARRGQSKWTPLQHGTQGQGAVISQDPKPDVQTSSR